MSVTVMLGGNLNDIGPTLESAIQLTKRLKTTLTGLCALPDPATSAVYITGAEAVMMGAAAIQSLTEAQDKLVQEFQSTFSDQVKAAGTWLKADFKKEIGSVASHGAAAAAFVDAFILPKAATNSGHPLNPVFEHVLMEANLPLVLAADEATISDTCMIAWDGSPLAARAVRLHLPLIRSYKKVVIAQNPEKVRHQWAHVSTESKERLAEMLRAERMEVSDIEIAGPVSDALLKAAQEQDASLIVMGAYGHNRIGQMLFGGTTSKLLQSEAAPALALCR
ncbi:MAG: universal stress protein [Henriciella sp.]